MDHSPDTDSMDHQNDADIRTWFQTLEPRPDMVPSPQFRDQLLAQMAEPPPSGWQALGPRWRAVLTPALATGFALSLALNVWWGTQKQPTLLGDEHPPGPIRSVEDGSQTPSAHPTPDVAQGDRYVAMAAYNEAIGAYGAYLETEGRATADVLEKLAAVYSRTSQYEAARDTANAALVIDPGSAPAYWYRGSAHEALGNRELALQDWKRAASRGHGEAQETLRKLGITW